MPWRPPAHWLTVTTIDAHTGGEPLRIITGGFPDIPGGTLLARRRHARAHLDALRTALMWEPRGHADMYGCILLPPDSDEADIGVLFLHNEGYSTMCGHGIIALVKAGLESGLIDCIRGGRPFDAQEEAVPLADGSRAVRIDTPAGLVRATAHVRGGRVERVAFVNVPSFLLERDVRVPVSGIGDVRCDIAFGGAFYAYVEAASVGLRLLPESHGHIIEAGTRIKRALASHPIVHPAASPELNYLYGVILVEYPGGDVHSRNVCVFADGELDRSPTGTGVSGRLAIHYARGELRVGETITVESLVGSRFDGRVVSETSVGQVRAVIPEVSGTAHITGVHQFVFDPDDPLRDGFLLR